jgi:hypothetical protein
MRSFSLPKSIRGLNGFSKPGDSKWRVTAMAPNLDRQIAFARMGTALAFTALAAVSVGALSIGALSVGALTMGKGRIKKLRIDELDVGSFTGAAREIERARAGGQRENARVRAP